MDTIGVRELRQNASVYLRRVASGESILVTDRGQPVAMLVPPPRHETLHQRLVASGELIPAERPGMSALLGPPLPAKAGPSASDELRRMRAEERW